MRDAFAEGFAYTSDTNTEWLDVERLREMVGPYCEDAEALPAAERRGRPTPSAQGAWQAPGA